MLNNITKEALDFLEEAKNAFESNYKMITYRSKDDEFIALRNGFNESIIDIYEISQPVGRFTDQLPSQYSDTILSNELNELKKLKDIVQKVNVLADYYYDKYGDNHLLKEVLASFYVELSKAKFK